jgi:type IV pilus assembly protein PilF
LLAGENHSKSKKRVVVLSPKVRADKDVSSLSRHGLKPIMENSVMATSQQEAELKAQSSTSSDENKRIAASTPGDKKKAAPSQKQQEASQGDEKVQTEVVVAKTPNKTGEVGSPMVSLPIHVVKKGDSLFAISKQYNIVMKSLQRWNKLRRPYTLKIGDVLYLADPKSPANR